MLGVVSVNEVSSPLPRAFNDAPRHVYLGWGARLTRRHLSSGLILAFVDVLTVQIALALAALVFARVSGVGWTFHAWTPLLAVGVVIALLFLNAEIGLYDTVGRNQIERFRLRILGVTLMPWPVLAILTISGGNAFPEAAVLMLAWALLLPLGFFAEAGALHFLLRFGAWGETAALFGSESTTARLAAYLTEHPELGLRPIGQGPQQPAGAQKTSATARRATVSDVGRLADTPRIAVVALSAEMPAVDASRLPFGRVIVVPDVSGLPALWLSPCGLGEVCGFAFSNRIETMAGHWIKRLFDLCVAVLLLILALPVIGVLALLIKLLSPGPAFYTQQRVGLRGTPIEILKLRSMHVDAERRLQKLLEDDAESIREWNSYMKLARDPRILPIIGHFMRRTSLDELPQLWNVVRGDLSLVGPRPFPAYHVSRFDPAFQALRERVKPGLTGLWQVTERSNADLRRQEAIDTFYIRNWSLWLDFYIVMRTLPALISTRGAR